MLCCVVIFYREMRYDAINFMGKRQVSKNLQLKVLKYIDYLFEREKDSPESGMVVLN